jgi:hypothetical protein
MIDIYVWPGPSNPTYYAQSLVNAQDSFGNISCTISSPDGTQNTFMPTDASLSHAGTNVPGLSTVVGALIFFYTPTQVGNYSVTANFPGQSFNTDRDYSNLNLTVYYQPSATTAAATFTVQKDQVLSGVLNGYPWSPLPNDYWTTPVSINNREWSEVSGDWVQAKYGLTKYRRAV